MASLVIRNLDEGLKERLRVRAAQHGRSMEEEVRVLLRSVLGSPVSHDNLADLATSLFGSKGVDLEPHPDVPVREAPTLDG
jgi:plasmid stability protein